MWVKVNIGTGAVEKQNYSRVDLKADNLLVSFPKVISAENLALYGVHTVIVDDILSYDAPTENGIRGTTVVKVGSTYHLTFTVVAKTGAEQTAYFEDKRAIMLLDIEIKGHEVCLSGTTVDGEFVLTDLEHLSQLLATAVDTSNSRRVKTGPGTFVTLNPAQLKTRREGADQFLQECIDKEDSLSIAANAATDMTELLAIDINAGWPT